MENIDSFRPNAPHEIQKIIDCYNKNLGCSVYECPECHDIIFVGHTCKSRFCSSCGYKYKNDRVESIMQTAYNCQHRQKHSIHSKMIPLIKHHCRKFRKQLLKYEVSISLAFKRDPYNCPKCDTKMNFVLCIY